MWYYVRWIGMQLSHKCDAKRRHTGFSFVELSVVLLAVGLVLGMSISAGMTQIKMLEVTKTQQQLQTVKNALNAFREKNGRYPCPALEYESKGFDEYPDLQSWMDDWGQPTSHRRPDDLGVEFKGCERYVYGNATSTTQGLWLSSNAFSGAVPFKTLGLNESTVTDTWGKRLTYVVDLVHTVKSTLGGGAIDVVDASGNSLVQSPSSGKAVFVVISHGKNGSGAYAQDAGVRNSCDATTKDAENCNGDAVFLDANVNESDVSANYTDDYIVWDTKHVDAQKELKHMATVKEFSSGTFSTCAVKTDGSLWCWGENTTNNLGTGQISFKLSTPSVVLGGGAWKKVDAARSTACGLKSDNTAWCWGDNTQGQVGDGTKTARTSPVAVSGGGSWKDISAGNSHTCAIKSDDTLWCWGNNSNGQLGDGTYTERFTPTQISAGDTWKYLSVGFYNTCAIKSDDTLWCWGTNTYGELGIGSTSMPLVPTQVSGGGSWKQVARDENHTCAIKVDDTLWCWGDNSYGGLGNGSTLASLVPMVVSSSQSWLQVTVGQSHSCGIKADETLWCWGSDERMALGDNNISLDKTLPVQVSGGGVWKQVKAGLLHTCAVQKNDTLWCWGNDWFGQLGYGFDMINGRASGVAAIGTSSVLGVPAPVAFSTK
jgi:alpha-tubulin suppressor-like RCC1 family protein/type II secretory pathway pseudopilin PulG